MSKTKETRLEPRKGAIALCTIGNIGLITCDAPQEVEYPDGTKGMAWTGIHLAERTFKWPFGPKKDQEETTKVGEMWSSKKPKVICYLEDLLLFSKNSEVFHELVNDLNVNADQDLQWFKSKLYKGYAVPSSVVKAKPSRSVDVVKGLLQEYELACKQDFTKEPFGSKAYNDAMDFIQERTGEKHE